MTTLRKILRPHGGFLTYGPAMAMDALRGHHHRDQEKPDEGEIIARFPSSCTASIEGDELVIRSGSADTPVTFEGDDVEALPDNREEHAEHEEETDRHSMDRRITRDRAPHTLAALNEFNQQFYGRRQRPRGG
jgi:hypothetical protein